MTRLDPKPLRLGVLLSGGGRTLQNLIHRISDGSLRAEVACVVSNSPSAYGLERARSHGLPAYVADSPQSATRDDTIYRILREHGVDYVCMAGYLKLLRIEPDFRDRILNIHPSLLPAFGGPGFYGDRVHRAVLEAGVDESGCTVHMVDEIYDNGRVLLQLRVPVLAGDSVRSLADRVFAAEQEAYPAVLQRIAEGVEPTDPNWSPSPDR